MHRNNGFTLIEIAIVLVIVGLLLSAIMLRSETVIGNTKTTGTITLIKDLNSAINDFKTRYHYLPGDMPSAGADINNISASCNIATSTGSIGDGQVNTTAEVGCVAEHLVRAGLIKGDIVGIVSPNSATTPDVFFTARRTVGANPPTFSAINEIQLTNQPCDTAKAIDSKLDDGDFSTGNIRASVATCSSGDPVPYLDIAL